MKRIIYLLFVLMAINLNSQEIIKPALTYYSADSTRNRTDINRAGADAVKIWKDSGFVEMEVKLYQPTLIYRFPKVDVPTIRDTFLIQVPPVVTFKDSLVWGWSKIRLNKLKQIVFTYRTKAGGHNYQTNHLKVLDTLIFRSCPETDFCTRDSMRFNIRTKYIDGVAQLEADEVSDFEFAYHFERSQDVVETITQTYANKIWGFDIRQADAPEELLLLNFERKSDAPGTVQASNGSDGLQDYDFTNKGALFRHSQKVTKKYYQIRLVDLETGFSIVLDIENNEFM